MSHRTAELSRDPDDGHWHITFWRWSGMKGMGQYTSSSTWAQTRSGREAMRIMADWLKAGKRPESPK